MNIVIDLFRLFVGFVLQIFPYAYLAILPFCDNLRLRYSRLLTVLLLLLMAFIFSISCTIIKYRLNDSDIIFQVSNAIFMLLFILCVIFYCYIVKTPIFKKIPVVCLIAIFAFFVSLSSTTTWQYITFDVIGSSYSEGSPYSLQYIGVLLVFTAATFPIAYRLIKRHVIPMMDIFEPLDLKYMSWLSAILLVLLSVSYAFLNSITTSITVIFCLVLCIFAASIYTVIFLFVKQVNKTQKLRLQLLKSEYINNMAQEQYQHICENIESQQYMRHNFRQQLITLRGLCDTNDGNIREYLSTYLQQIPEYTIQPICANPLLNSIMSYYKSTAEAEHFTVTCNIHLPIEMHISDVDLVTILGNLLENAIDAGKLLPSTERKIVINIDFSHKMLGITVDNSFDGNILMKDGMYISTKHHHTAVGLQSVKNIAEKYNGNAVFQHNNKIFYASVMLVNTIPNKKHD